MERKLGDYTLVRELGRGGMGVVWAARHPRFGQVALKVVLDGALWGGDPDLPARMRREAAALMRLTHPNVVRMCEVGEHGGQPFVAMALVDGESLHERLRRGPLDAADAARVTLGIARALTHVHSQGVLHRDLKPHNVLLRRDGEPVLVDFGLARLSLDRQRLTTTGQVLGTPAYMAPEQALSAGRPTSAIDVYGLGATLYQMLCGDPPFTGANPIAIMSRVLEQAPTPPSLVTPRVDPELERLCLACLEKDPARRPESAELVEALERWRGSRTAEARRGRGRPSPWRRPALVGAAALGLAALLVAWVATRTAGPAPPTTSTSIEVAPVPTATFAPPPPVAVADPPPASHDEPLELLRRAVPLVTEGQQRAVEALQLARRATHQDPGAPRVLLAAAWVTRSAARAGVEEPPWALLDEAERLIAAAAVSGAASEVVGPLREALVVDRQQLEVLFRHLEGQGVQAVLDAALLSRRLGRHEQALELLEVVRREAGPGHPDVDVMCAFNSAGDRLLLRGPSDAACAEYLDVLDLARETLPQAKATWYALCCRMRAAEIRDDMGRFEEGLDHADAALRLPRVLDASAVFGPEDEGRLERLRARALAHLRRWAEALEAAERAIAVFAQHPDEDLATPEAARGAALVGLGRTQEGRQAMRVALAIAQGRPLNEFRMRFAVCALVRLAFPGDPELEALIEATFP